jgi:predicted transcriptional regulator
MSEDETLDGFNLPGLTADIVSAYVSNNSVPIGELRKITFEVHRALAGLQGEQKVQEPVEPQRPPVSIKKSITPDYLISLEDGKPYKALKRQLTKLGISPAEYRARLGLPIDYPMVAPNYAVQRSELARRMGLGRNLSRKRLPRHQSRNLRPRPEPIHAPKKRGRKPKA